MSTFAQLKSFWAPIFSSVKHGYRQYLCCCEDQMRANVFYLSFTASGKSYWPTSQIRRKKENPDRGEQFSFLHGSCWELLTCTHIISPCGGVTISFSGLRSIWTKDSHTVGCLEPCLSMLPCSKPSGSWVEGKIAMSCKAQESFLRTEGLTSRVAMWKNTDDHSW